MLYKQSTARKNKSSGKIQFKHQRGVHRHTRFDMSLNIHPSFSKEFIRELGSATACVSSSVTLEIHCAAAVKSSPEPNGLGSMYTRQGRHSHRNTAHFTNCLFVTWLTEINPNQTYYQFPSSALFCLGSLKWNKSVRLTRQRASCQSTVPLSERRGTISIAKRWPHPRRTLVFPQDLDQRQDPPFTCSRLQACYFPIVCKSGRWWEHLHPSLRFVSFQDAFLWSDVTPDAHGFQLWLHLFWPSHAHFPL